MILLFLLAVVASVFAGWRAWRRLSFFLHVFQLEGYKAREYAPWLIRRARKLLVRWSHGIAILVLILSLILVHAERAYGGALLALALWPILFASSRVYRRTRPKKPLKFTARLIRLAATSGTVAAAWIVGGLLLTIQTDGPSGYLWLLAGFLTADLGSPLWVLVGAVVMAPVEASLQNRFKSRARRTIGRHPNLTIVGITGSYGKTSVKFIIGAILRQRFSVLATPGSYNTPMGICLVINQKLRPEHQVLILEMGARREGDIRELCEIAMPDIAVVTSVGVAHLETFGSIQDIEHEKGSLLTFSKKGAIAVLNGDDERVARMKNRANGAVWLTSTEGKDAQITAREVRYDAEGASFKVRDESGDEYEFRTRLLGLHNVGNILLGVAVGRAMGLRLRQIARAVAQLEPVEHRLQLKREGHLTIIDDAFNANPVGARNAVEILGQFGPGRRIIVTPGMVELGARHVEENREFGRQMARHADLAILVGDEQTRPIQDGLRDADYPADQVRVVSSLFEARDLLRQVAGPGDVVLFENDLPDQYDSQ